MNMFFQAVVSSLAIGSVYTLLALGYTIIFSTMQMSHFAQGEIFMIGAFLGYTFYVASSIPFPIAVVVSIIITIFVMLIIERLAYRPMYSGPSIYLILSTIGMSIFLKNLAQLIWSSDTFPFPSIFGDEPQYVGGIMVVPQSIVITSICVALMIGIYLFMKKTKTGVAMRAVSMNKSAASLMGIKLTRIMMITYGMGAALAAVAGILVAPIYKVYAGMGTGVGIKALTAAVMGGFGNVQGAMVGGLLLGLIETLGSGFISSQYKDAIAFLVLIAVLLVRPQGLFGKAKIKKV